MVVTKEGRRNVKIVPTKGCTTTEDVNNTRSVDKVKRVQKEHAEGDA